MIREGIEGIRDSGNSSESGTIAVVDPWSLLPPNGDSPVAAFMTVRNNSSDDRKLISVQSDAFDKIDVHRNEHVGRGVDETVRMVAVESLQIPSWSERIFAPGGMHLMLSGRREALSEGEEVTFTLRFDNGARQEHRFRVRALGGRGR